MSTLAEVENAARTLPVEEREELLLSLAAGLREEGNTLPLPREFSAEQIQGWIAEDERGMREFLACPPKNGR